MIYRAENPHGGDVYKNQVQLDFSANINPFGPPTAVKNAIYASIDRIASYPDACCGRLRTALAAYENVREADILCGNGAAELIYLLVQTLMPRKALIVQPTFCEYEQALLSVRTQISYYQLQEENGFVPGEELLDRLHADLDMVFLCNPNNPTGRLLPTGLMHKIAAKCQERNILLFVDECFLDFTGAKTRHSLASQLSGNEQLFLLKAFTKSFALPGLRLGYCLTGNHRLLAGMAARMQPWNVSLPAQEAGEAALLEQDYLDRTVALITSERRRLIKELHSLGIKVCPGQANFLLLKSPVPLYEALLEHQILIRKCSNFPGLDDCHYRIAIRLPAENDQLLNALKEVLNG